MLVLTARPGPPTSPFLVWSGFFTFALFRDAAEIIRLEKMPGRVRRAIRASGEVMVMETGSARGSHVRSYNVRVLKDPWLKWKLRRERKKPIF